MRYDVMTRHGAIELLDASKEGELAAIVRAGLEAQTRIDDGTRRAGDDAAVAEGIRARKHFIEANVRLVLSTANRMPIPPHVDRNDVVQDGMVGLDRAVTGFDERMGFRFSTYATWWIRQAMQRGLEHTASSVRIPAHRATELRTALRESPDDRPPAPLATIAALSNFDSLDRPMGDGTDTIGDLAPCSAPGPEELAEAGDERALLASMLASLDQATVDVLIARFGLDGREPATYRSIAGELGISQEAVRRRVLRALEHLRARATQLAA